MKLLIELMVLVFHGVLWFLVGAMGWLLTYNFHFDFTSMTVTSTAIGLAGYITWRLKLYE